MIKGELLFQLLQVAIGTRNSLDRQPTSKEWVSLFETSKRQALLAIAFIGVKKLKVSYSTLDDLRSVVGMDEMTYLKWFGMTVKVAQRNKSVLAACVELVRHYSHDSMACCILKGQGNLEYYPEDLRDCRTPGDIDVWCKTADSTGIDLIMSDLNGKGAHYQKYNGKEAVIEYVKMLRRLAELKPYEEVRYHHIKAPSVKGVDVEVHFRPIFLHSPFRNYRLQKWFLHNEQFGLHDAKIGNAILPLPTDFFNAVYQLCHIYRHLFDEGIGLKQLLDYYFVLQALFAEKEEGKKSNNDEEIMHVIGGFGMKKFTAAVMYVLQTVFAMPDQYLLCPPNVKEGKFLLDEIMQAGNFGKYDTRIVRGPKSFMGLKVSGNISHAIEKTKHNLRLLTHYPEEVLWEPFFRIYHYFWRKLRLWRFE